ncbi:HupE/UreJ family protein [Roseateles oligotrophus]|uniref:HupE/UreJ family protein n=1 Tax=Roseateles oligotrophus TaxID=1769250 RepID=A0ABT2YCF4_9BURK|nr:HupE/UreJ family protein [Roseateles oligotrophus]MCV2367733.1 HupE/UreJ family protein [Roseateles oligotrophus]
MMRFILILLALALAGPVQAHKSSDAYLTLQVSGSTITQRLDIALQDLDRDLDLDANDDKQLSWGELRTRWPELERLVADTVKLSADGRPCMVDQKLAPQLDQQSDGTYAVLQQTLQCAAPVQSLAMDYRLFAGSDAKHRGIARLLAGGDEQSAVLIPAEGVRSFQLNTSAQEKLRSLGGFIVEGMHHISVGLDHILFLLSLLMVAVWRREGRGWVARATPRSAWREAFKLVTAFTLAHSLTLGLAAAGVLAPPSRWVESLIAASVLVAAVDNLRPFVRGPRWLMVALFGLVHGFGFAGPLQALGLQRGNLALPLLGFNLGVELAQLGLVALILPLAIAMRDKPLYGRLLVRPASALIGVLALLWLLERSLDLSLLA